jgi:hypothetical protein
MSAASNFLEAKLLDHVLKFGNGSVTVGTGSGYAPPATLYLALFVNTSGNAATNLEAGTLTDEVATAGTTAYARQTIAFDAATGTSPCYSANTSTITFPTCTNVAWGTITHVAIMDGATRGAGTVLFFGQVTTSKTIDVGDTFQVSAGNLTVALA